MIISKVLTHRFALQTGDVVKDYQFGFIKGRNILEGVAITKVVICQYIKTGRQGYY